jgi:predicted ATPase
MWPAEAIAGAIGFAAEGGELEPLGAALLAVIARGARAGAQFVIATHSPILLACPGARIYELTERGIDQCAYDDVDAVRLTRGFLDDPERYLRAALPG